MNLQTVTKGFFLPADQSRAFSTNYEQGAGERGGGRGRGGQAHGSPVQQGPIHILTAFDPEAAVDGGWRVKASGSGPPPSVSPAIVAWGGCLVGGGGGGGELGHMVLQFSKAPFTS